MSPFPPLPQDIEQSVRRARRLEWWTLFWLATIVLAMFLTMGSSQAMRAAWIEDLLSLLPPVLVIVGTRIERMEPTPRFPFGFHRVGSLAFLIAATVLAGLGGLLIVDATFTLAAREHPTIGTVTLWNREVWLGWLMIAALAWSVVPPVILGRMKKPLARTINDKVLYTDADMNAADWKTGAAGIVGIIGIGAGFWWADAAAAGLIGLDILRDGWRNGRVAVAELLDGAPRQLGGNGIDPCVERIETVLDVESRGMRAQVRETGRFLRVTLTDSADPLPDREVAETLLGDQAWRLVAVNRALDT